LHTIFAEMTQASIERRANDLSRMRFRNADQRDFVGASPSLSRGCGYTLLHPLQIFLHET
jgi:hypothetical protein